MRLSPLIGATMATLATAAPITEGASSQLGQFHVTNFSFGCTATCDWSFQVTVGPNSTNHPGFTKPVKCSGSTTTQSFKNCAAVAGDPNQSLQTYITKDNQLRLQYTVEEPSEGLRFWYNGHKKVNAVTSGKPQAKNFYVKETRASAVG